MRHRLHGNRLSRAADHRKALLRNLATSLILHGKLKTTTAKAKALKSHFEKLMNRVRKINDLNAIRFLDGETYSKRASKQFLKTARGLKQESGWLRSTKIGLRDGDKAEITLVEIIVQGSDK
jgi:large subunit ribosomal protein L17